MKQNLHSRKLFGMRYFTSMLLFLFITGFCTTANAMSDLTDKSDYSSTDRASSTGEALKVFNGWDGLWDTKITDLSPSSGNCGTSITVSAKLSFYFSDFLQWYTCVNQTITFALGSVTVTATTNLLGEAYAIMTVPDPAATLTASFAGGHFGSNPNEKYKPSSASINFDNHAVIGTTVNISGDNNVCDGVTNVIYSVPEVTNATSYVWTAPPGATISQGQGSTSIKVTFGSTSGNITFTPSNNCYTGTTNTLSVTVNSKPPQPGLITGSSAVCHGSSQTYSIEPVSGASFYNWNFPPGWYYAVNTSSTATATVGYSAVSGSVSVQAVNAGCYSFTRYFSVDVVDIPARPAIIYGSATVCQGTSQVYNVTPVLGANSYTWTLPSGWSGASTSEAITATVGQDGGTISVIANNSCGSSMQQTLNVSVTAPPVAPGPISGPTSICQGSLLNYSITPVPGATSYNWSVPTGWSIDDGQGTNSITVTTGSSGQNGNITVVPNYEWGSCQSSQVIDIYPDISENCTGYVYNGSKVSGDIRCNSSYYNYKGYIKFPLSSIPTDAIIRAAILYITNKEGSVSSDPKNYIKGLGNTDPVTASFSTLNASITYGSVYNLSVWANTGTLSLALNSIAVTHLQNYLSSQGYISLGLIKGEASDYNNYYFYGYSSGADAPKLAVIAITSAAGSSSTLPVIVNATLEAPLAGDISTIYDGEIHIGTATPPAGSNVNWYDAATLGNITVAPSSTNVGIYTAWAESINATGCKSTSRTQVTVTIDKANAAIVVTPYNVTYDGNAHTATFTAVGVESPVPVDLTGLMDVSLTTHTNANTYNGDAWTFAGNGNYNSANGTVNDAIAKADANVSVTGGTWTYDATEHGAAGTATGVGGVALTGLELGSSFINVPGGIANWAFTDVTGNYNNKSGSVAITIEQKAALVTPIPNSKYCGQIDPALTGTLTGFLTGDGVTAIYSRNTGESVGSNYLISAVLSPTTVLSNYTITYNTANFAIIALTSIDASESSTPVPLGSTPTLKATVTPNVSGVSVTFNVENGNGSISSFYAMTDGSGLASVTGIGLTAVDVYKVIAVAGSDCGSAATSIAYLAVYDPNGGFVTGGGWIMSPAGAYIANPALTGKANFGFVAKYKKGSNVPDGNTEFQFHEGNLNFSSSSYDLGSLVIAGYKAIYKGVGTINNTGNYKFMVSAVDGDVTGGGGYDKFRIKIWDKTSGAIVYDNNLGKDENDVSTTTLGGGSIVIHKADNKNTKSIQMAEFGLKIYPNPFTDHIYFDLQLKTDSKVRLEIFDISGTKLATLYNDVVVAFDRYQLEYIPKNVSSGILLYHLIVDGQLMFDGKLIHY